MHTAVPDLCTPALHSISASQVNLQTGRYRNFRAAFAAVRSLTWLGRAHAFWRGLLLTYARDMPFSCVQMTLYAQLSRRVADGQPYSAKGALCGAAAAATASCATTPLDVLRTRSLEGGAARSLRGAPVFAGVLPRVVAAALGGFVFFGCYEAGKPIIAHVLRTTHVLDSEHCQYTS